MTTLVHAALTARKTARASYALVVAGLMGAACLLRVFAAPITRDDYLPLGLGALWLATFLGRAAHRFRNEEQGRRSVRTDVELGLLLLVATHAAVQQAGGLDSELYPLVYVLIAFVASFGERRVGGFLIPIAVIFEGALYLVTEPRLDPKVFAFHAVFIVFFGILSLLFTRVEIARVRERSRRERDEEKKRVEDESRMFRLVQAPTTGAVKDEERLFRSSLAEVHNSLYHTLELVKRSLDLHTCVLLFLDDDGGALRIAELVTSSDEVLPGPFSVGAGAVGGVASRGLVMNLEHIRPGYRGLCYYDGPAPVRAFLGVPVVEEGRTIGALCADRLEDRPFGPKDEELLRLAAIQIVRITENERVFVQLEQSKHEQHTLYRASQALGSALTEDQVLDAGVAALRDVTHFDVAAITLYDPKKRQHAVRRVVGDGAAALEGFTFADNNSLTAMAVKNAHYLPYRGEFDPRQQFVFTKRSNLTGMASLLIVPLVVREAAIGTIVLGARKERAFGPTVRPTLQVLGNHLAVSLANAAAVRRLEEMATTDGLTGCLNKRAFLDELEGKMRSAERFGRTLSLIVTDIDHFKSVNDTYGHATGDVVIRELGQILKRVKRETDVVARFGGEEFCILCEETDSEGGVHLAERVREELENMAFQTEMGALRVTCSLGVATYPSDASSAAELFESADKALYAAKNSGRNRVCTL